MTINLHYNEILNSPRLLHYIIKMDKNLILGSPAAPKQCFHSDNNNNKRQLQTVAQHTPVCCPAKKKGGGGKKQSYVSAHMA